MTTPVISITRTATLSKLVSALHSSQHDFSVSPRNKVGMSTLVTQDPFNARPITLVFTKDGDLHPAGMMCSMDKKGVMRFIKELHAHAASATSPSQINTGTRR